MNNIEILEEFIKHYKEVQEKYKDDEIQAEIERSCYFEEVPAEAIENLIQENKELKKENVSYREYFGNPPCYDDAKYIKREKAIQILQDEIWQRQFELQQEYKDFKDDVKLNTLQNIKQEFEE